MDVTVAILAQGTPRGDARCAAVLSYRSTARIPETAVPAGIFEYSPNKDTVAILAQGTPRGDAFYAALFLISTRDRTPPWCI